MAGHLRLLNGMALISWEMRAAVFIVKASLRIGRVTVCEWELVTKLP